MAKIAASSRNRSMNHDGPGRQAEGHGGTDDERRERTTNA
jgi:hypothetical protein